jgi:CheY-like chemotaxis protein
MKWTERSRPDHARPEPSGLDGYGVLQRLRSRPSTSQIPVIVLTAKGDEDNEVRVFQMGADDFLTSPSAHAPCRRGSRRCWTRRS